MASYVHCNPLSPRAHRRDEQAGPSGIVRLRISASASGDGSRGQQAPAGPPQRLSGIRSRGGQECSLTSEVPFCQGDGGGRGRPLWPLCVPAGRRVAEVESEVGRPAGTPAVPGACLPPTGDNYAGRAAPSGTGISDTAFTGVAARITSSSCRRTGSREESAARRRLPFSTSQRRGGGGAPGGGDGGAPPPRG